MQNLIDFLRKHLYWLVFLVFEVISLISLFKYNSYQGSVYFTTANQVVGSIYSLGSGVVSYLNLGKVNENLEADNEQLRQELYQLKQHMRKVGAVPDTLPSSSPDSIISPYSYHLVQANVVRNSVHRSNNLMTIDKGRADGIRPEMGVVCSQGIVGIVFLTSAHYSIVIPLLNTSSQLSCRLHHTEYFGTLSWMRGDPTVSYVTGIPRHAKVHKGSIIETNGYSDIFPEGIPVGTVIRKGEAADGMTYQLTVRLSVDFSTLRNVSVITDYTKPERQVLEQRADSLMDEN